MLAAVSFPIYVKAFFNALFGRDISWQATHRVDTYDSPFDYMRIQVYIFCFLALTAVIGIWKSSYTQEFSVSIVWSVLNAAIFGTFMIVALKEARRVKMAYRRIVKQPARRRQAEIDTLGEVAL
jgi:cellulose synthase (UDP-forming)